MFAESEDVTITPTFEEMDLPENLLRGIFAFGFEKPSQIQSKAIMPMKQRRDILAQARSGTGKTGAFVIGSLSNLRPEIKKPQVLIIVHTHELADQIAKIATDIGQPMKVKVLCAIGGNRLDDDIRTLQSGAQFIVGTPGRIYDLVNRDVLDRNHIQYLIMDEADQMLEDLFYKQIMTILGKGFPQTTRVALFSATMAPQVVEVAHRILENPVRILIPPNAVRLEGIQQFFISIDQEDHKFECICDLYKHLDITQTVIFCNNKQKVHTLAEKMNALGFPVSSIHGDMDKPERKKRMADFKNGNSRIMIATDIIARGIDIQQLSLVINYELPGNKANYVHRIGRAGRFGRKGTTINLLLPDEEGAMAEICDYYGMAVNPLPNDLNSLLV